MKSTISPLQVKNTIFTDKNFNEFIYKSQKISTKKKFNDARVTKKSQSNFQAIEVESNQTNTSVPQMNHEIIEWRILYSTQDKNAKKKFLETFINGKHKDFFYKSLI